MWTDVEFKFCSSGFSSCRKCFNSRVCASLYNAYLQKGRWSPSTVLRGVDALRRWRLRSDFQLVKQMLGARVTRQPSATIPCRSPYLLYKSAYHFSLYSHLLQGTRQVLKKMLIECAAVAFRCVLDSTRNGDLTSLSSTVDRLATGQLTCHL